MTHDQHIASDPAFSVWVSASAGTGKTKVLTDRVLRLLLDGAPPGKILCITYTRAASAEMESRIGGQLAEWVTADDDRLRATLGSLTGAAADKPLMTRARRLFAQVLDAPQRIRIQTIHSFCQSVLMRFPLESGVPPHFTPIDDTTARELLTEARARLFSEAALPENRLYAEAIASLSIHISEATLHELIAGIIRQRRLFGEWLASGPGGGQLYEILGLTPDMDSEKLARKHLSYPPETERALREACAALAQGSGESDRRTCEALGWWLEKREDIAAHLAAFITKEGTPRKVFYTKSTFKHAPSLAEALMEEQRRLIGYQQERQSLFVAEMSRHVAVLANAILEVYNHLKERSGYLDYDDLILYTVRLLGKEGVASWVLYKLDQGIDHLLIDEAQDTAPEQWRIVDSLVSEFFAGEGASAVKRTLFVVGDEKQSIYSFQGAEPLAFDAMRRKLARMATASDRHFRRVRLALSYRSTAPVLKAVDTVFALPQAQDGLIFDEADIRHDVKRAQEAGRVELWPLAEAAEEEHLPPWHIADKALYAQRPEIICANRIADTIAGWLNEKRLLASQARPLRPGDIMILVQRRGAFADALLRALKRRAIPVAGADRLTLTEHIAVMDCMALGRFLLLPQDSLTLAEVLRSPFMGLSEEALFELAYDRGEATLWQRLKGNPAYKDAYTFLSELLARTDYLPPYELFAHILGTCGGRRKLAQRLGSEIDDPLNEFLSLALEYGKVHPPSLQGFLRWLESGEIEIKRDMEKGRDEVRILTVHGAKGLQAPIVFLPDTTRVPLHEGGILWHPSKAPLYSPLAAHEDRHYRALKQAKRSEAEREYHRLLYVAMTRAEDELYICGWKGRKAIDSGCWYEFVRHAAESWEKEGDNFMLSSPQTSAVQIKPVPEMVAAPEKLPGWVHRPAASEPVPSRPLAPSRLQVPADTLPHSAMAARERGSLIHRLLQYLPEVVASERGEVLQRLMKRHVPNFSETDKQRIASEVLAILNHPQFGAVFAEGSVAEASITGMTRQRNPLIVAGRIDRIAVHERDVYIVEYKTGRRVPRDERDVPEGYIRQIQAYRELVAKIYPDKTVHCGILWTSEPRLMILSDALLESLAA